MQKKKEIIDKASLVEFNKKEKDKTVLIFKIIIFLFIIVNILIIVFVIIFKSQISSIITLNSHASFNITQIENKNKDNEADINTKLVMLYASRRVFHHEFLQIIANKEEYIQIMKLIHSHFIEMSLCYSNTEYTHYSYDLFDYCKYSSVLVFLLKTSKGHRFGGVVFDFSFEDRTFKDIHAVLYNLDSNQRFKVNNSSNAYTFIKDQEKIIFGDEDLVINFNFKSKDSYAKFPREYGDKENDKLSDLIGEEEGNFSIVGIEIIARIDYEDEDS